MLFKIKYEGKGNPLCHILRLFSFEIKVIMKKKCLIACACGHARHYSEEALGRTEVLCCYRITAVMYIVGDAQRQL